VRVRWRRTALADLKEIAEYIAKENPAAARLVVSEIRREVTVLDDHPFIGRVGRVSDTREMVVTKYPYIVAYEVRDRAIEILAVVHTSRLWPESFR
jgi:toxin ParE1/3/4